MTNKVCISFDESGNFGTKGRYFTIAGIISKDSNKPLKRVMKRATLKTKKQFEKYKDVDEVKASDSYPCIKEYFLRKIVSKDITIRYVVCDLHHTMERLLKDENVLYNYLLQFLIIPEAADKSITELEINIDKRTIKVNSVNSFEDYIKTKLIGEHGLDIKITVNYMESQNCYAVQAADFVANAVNSMYEWNHYYYYDLISEKCVQRERFPRHKFGK